MSSHRCITDFEKEMSAVPRQINDLLSNDSYERSSLLVVFSVKSV
jgi:hypothetical protein